ncbi:MAG: sodium-dependent bicarbonate transport family permease, partial [Nitrosospira sp.]
MATIQPVVLFFVLGVLAGVLKSDLKIPEALYKSLSIFLLIAIGFKGGVAMAKY